ncbi:MAG: 6-bladed beta-propeller [Deltaproteobacteria bacterium]|nr:6-bladed beta-propeller [Deltaproteobacteria bacterium]
MGNFWKRGIFIVFLTAILFTSVAGVGLAELPPPTWMPGFPIMAGPQLMLMWSPVAGAVKYKVFVNGKMVAETAVFQHFMPAPEEAGEYKVKVVAVDASGKDSPPSREWVTKVFKLAPPATVYDRATEKSVNLRWEVVPSAMVYNVYKRVGKATEYKLLASVQDTSYTDSDVKKDVEMRYAISAKDASGKESAKSKDVVAMIKTEVISKAAYQDLIPITSKVLMVMRGGTLPDGRVDTVKNPGGVTEVEGQLFVPDATRGIVHVFDRASGEYKGAIGKQGNGPGQLNRPIGISHDRDGNLLVCDAFMAKIVRLKPSGEFVDEFPLPRYVNAKLDINLQAGPSDIRQLSTGEFLVVDNANSRIMLLDPSGKYVKDIAFTDAKGATGFARPTSIDVDSKDHLYIADALNGRIVVAEKSGKVLLSIGQPGDIVGEFGGLLGVCAIEDMKWVIGVDSKHANLQIFSAETGKYLYSVASEDKKVALLLSIPQRATRLSDTTIAVSEALIDSKGGGIKIISIDKQVK